MRSGRSRGHRSTSSRESRRSGRSPRARCSRPSISSSTLRRGGRRNRSRRTSTSVPCAVASPPHSRPPVSNAAPRSTKKRWTRRSASSSPPKAMRLSWISTTPTWPSCGSEVPRNVALCPSCGARLAGAPAEPVAKRSAAGAPELDILVDDLLVGELEQSLTPEELELTKAAVLDWLIEELEETMGVDATIKAAASEKRDETKAAAEPSPVPPAVGFLSGWMRGSKGLVSGARPKTSTRGAGKVNGLVNGRGRVNGLVNGLGRTNGLVNGVGRVNGLVTPTGRVNGLMGEQGRVNGTISGTRSVRAGRKEIRVSSPSKRVRYLAIGAATLFAILVAGFLFIPISGPTPPIAIDGSFGDWASVPKFDAATVASDPYVSIVDYASLVDGNSLYLFASTRGGMFGDSSAYDGVYFLIDADGNPSTGYQFEGIGAEGVV